MGWGVTINGVYLSRLHTNMLRDKYEENERMMEYARRQILLLAAATPRDVAHYSDEIDAWEDYVQQEVENLLEIIEEAAGQNFVIVQHLEYPEDIFAFDT